MLLHSSSSASYLVSVSLFSVDHVASTCGETSCRCLQRYGAWAATVTSKRRVIVFVLCLLTRRAAAGSHNKATPPLLWVARGAAHEETRPTNQLKQHLQLLLRERLCCQQLQVLLVCLPPSSTVTCQMKAEKNWTKPMVYQFRKPKRQHLQELKASPIEGHQTGNGDSAHSWRHFKWCGYDFRGSQK